MTGDQNVFSFEVHVSAKNVGTIADMSNDDVNQMVHNYLETQLAPIGVFPWVLSVDIVDHR